jgi:hypothetical protein
MWRKFHFQDIKRTKGNIIIDSLFYEPVLEIQNQRDGATEWSSNPDGYRFTKLGTSSTIQDQK